MKMKRADLLERFYNYRKNSEQTLERARKAKKQELINVCTRNINSFNQTIEMIKNDPDLD